MQTSGSLPLYNPYVRDYEQSNILYIVTDLTVLQIWTMLLNGRVRISALPTQRCSFQIHGTQIYKSIATQCLQAERILPWQRILLTVKFPT
jgi:hypothetical protein